ncbi:MAG: hypothetical protein M3Y80_04550, partial [Verrucomicrobiota bacterium]|nr:hypothetical protein [Verrucomicrobiota bacterium]
MPDPKRASLSVLAAACWLALFLVVAKTAGSDLPWWPEPGSRLGIVVAGSFTDVLFALGFGLFAAAVVLVSGRGAGALRVLSLVLFAICALYAVIAAGVFRFFHRPLTYELLGLI